MSGHGLNFSLSNQTDFRRKKQNYPLRLILILIILISHFHTNRAMNYVLKQNPKITSFPV